MFGWLRKHYVRRTEYLALQARCEELQETRDALLSMITGLRVELDRRTDALKDFSREVGLLRTVVLPSISTLRQRRRTEESPLDHPRRRRDDKPVAGGRQPDDPGPKDVHR